MGAPILYSRPCGHHSSDTFPGVVVGHTDKKVKIKYNGWDVQGREGTALRAAVSVEAIRLQ